MAGKQILYGTKTARKAGLVMPVTRIRRHLRASAQGLKVYLTAGIYTAAVLEYLLAEILELSGTAAEQNKKKRIGPRHLQLAIRNDPELTELIGSAVIPQGGVVPHIHEALMPKDTNRRSSMATQASRKPSLTASTKSKQASVGVKKERLSKGGKGKKAPVASDDEEETLQV